MQKQEPSEFDSGKNVIDASSYFMSSIVIEDLLEEDRCDVLPLPMSTDQNKVLQMLVRIDRFCNRCAGGRLEDEGGLPER